METIIENQKTVEINIHIQEKKETRGRKPISVKFPDVERFTINCMVLENPGISRVTLQNHVKLALGRREVFAVDEIKGERGRPQVVYGKMVEEKTGI